MLDLLSMKAEGKIPCKCFFMTETRLFQGSTLGQSRHRGNLDLFCTVMQIYYANITSTHFWEKEWANFMTIFSLLLGLSFSFCRRLQPPANYFRGLFCQKKKLFPDEVLSKEVKRVREEM